MVSLPIPIVERSERETARRIRRRIQSLEDVEDCKEVTLSFTRKKPNIHFHTVLKGNPNFEDTHRICSKLDREVRVMVPNARVVIHSETTGTSDTKDVWKLVKKTADDQPGSRGVQNIHLTKIDGKLGVDFSLEVSTLLTGNQSMDLQTRVAESLKTTDARISDVVIHQESIPYLITSEQSGHGTELKSYVEHIARRFPELSWLGMPAIVSLSDGMHFVDRVAFAPGTSDQRATEIRSELGAAIKNGYPAISRIEIIEMPKGPGAM